MGEVVGITIAAGILAASTPIVIAVTFTLAYLAGMALTIGPLMQDSVGFGERRRTPSTARRPASR